MSKALTPLENEIIFYTTPDGAVHMEVFFLDETFWLSQKTNGRAVHGRGANSQLINYHLKRFSGPGNCMNRQLFEKFE
jgi:hypothetical protein